MLGTGLKELAICLIEHGLRSFHVFLSFIISFIAGLVNRAQLGIGLIELGIGLRINNAGAPSWPVYLAMFKV